MKKLIICFILVIAIRGFGQDLPTKDGKILYETVDSCGADKDKLYTVARTFFVNAFHNANYVIQMDDKESGTIIGKGNYDMRVKAGLVASRFNVKFTLHVTVRDNKYRVQVYDIWSKAMAPLESIDPHEQLDKYYRDYSVKKKKQKGEIMFWSELDKNCREIVAEANKALKNPVSDSF